MLLRSLTALLLVTSVLSLCPPGAFYNPTLNKCFQYVNVSTDYLAAEGHCKTLGGHLVDIKNTFENSYYNGQMQLGQLHMWIGMNYLTNPAWAWSTGAAATYTNWAHNEPSNSTANLCASMSLAEGKWVTEPCYSQRNFLCKIDPDQPPPSFCPNTCSGATCSPGYDLFVGDCNCYKYILHSVKTARTFTESQSDCAKDGATLPIILSKEQNAFLLSLTFPLTQNHTDVNNWAWIGLTCNSTSKTSCYWFDGTPMAYDNISDMTPKGLRGPTPFQMQASYPPAENLGSWVWADDTFTHNGPPITCSTFCQKGSIPAKGGNNQVKSLTPRDSNVPLAELYGKYREK